MRNLDICICHGLPVQIPDVFVINFDEQNRIIEGAEVFDALCPVSSVTGLRENPLALIKSLLLNPEKSRLLEQVLSELPVLKSSVDGASYDDMLASLQSVFSDSVPYENDRFADRLMQISEDLLKSVGIEKPISNVSKTAPSEGSEPLEPSAPVANPE